MKNILVLGASRTGKTTLSNIIFDKYPNYSIINMDAVTDGLIKFFPQIDTGFLRSNKPRTNLLKYINYVLEEQTKINGENMGYILEGEIVTPKDVEVYFNIKNCIVIFLGYNQLDEYKIFENCRVYEQGNDWTKKYSDNEILEHVRDHLKYSKLFEEECKKYGYQFLDVSTDRNLAFEEALCIIEKELERKE